MRKLAVWTDNSRISGILKAYADNKSNANKSASFKIISSAAAALDKGAGRLHDRIAQNLDYSMTGRVISFFRKTIVNPLKAVWAPWSSDSLAMRVFRFFSTPGAVSTKDAVLKTDVDAGRRRWLVYLAGIYVFLDYIFRLFLRRTAFSGYWDELLLAAAVLFWVYNWLAYRGEKAYTPTPLDFPLVLFFGFGIFLLIAAAPNMRIGIEGLRAVMEYMLWFFLIAQLLRSETGAIRLLILMVLAGTALGLHGIYQYASGTPMPSNWIDTAESGIRTRAFSIIGSPNILGSLMLILIPISLSFVLAEKSIVKKLCYLASTGIMLLCLVLTFSRSAWLGIAFAMLIFFLMKDNRKYLPLIVLAAAFVILFPPVWDRISYMLSGDYIMSSIKGGRLLRWPIGLRMVAENPVFGVGLGQFGGAVAMNNNIPGTFYMDNYFLKTAVEMGLTGLAAFVLLIYNAVIWSYRVMRNITDKYMKRIAQGLFVSIAGLIIPNFFENVFEVPMMVVYFWLMAAVMMFLGRRLRLYNSDMHIVE